MSLTRSSGIHLPLAALLAAACGYLVFVIYGSLVPLAFRPLPLEQAWQAFRAIPFLQLGIGSRADWVANLLLFIPLAFLWSGVLRALGVSAVLAALLIVVVCLGLSVGIEFTQLFFPPRTVSQNDILAEGLGAVVGVAAWQWQGLRACAWLDRWQTARGASTIAERLLWLYLALLFAYNLLPLDLTISPVEIYHKWREGKVVLVPFGRLRGDAFWQLYELLTDALIWTPVALLAILSGRQRALQAAATTVLIAAVLEGAQLLVYSRVTDITDVMMAVVGAALGVALARRKQPAGSRAPAASFGLGLAGYVLWLLLLAAVFWYPYDFLLERAFLADRVMLFKRVPFYTYYYGTEFRAVTEVLHKLIFFAPLGAALAWSRPRLLTPRRWFDAAAAMALIAAAVAIELGQVALPGKLPDSTDAFLGALGGAAGYVGTLWLRSRMRPAVHRPAVRAAPGASKP